MWIKNDTLLKRYMTHSSHPSKRPRIVIAGAGFGGMMTAYRLHRSFCYSHTIELVIVDRNNYFLFTPLLHEVATGSIAPGNIVEPIRKLLPCCLSDHYKTTANRLNLTRSILRTNDADISYDYLVLALGSQPNFYNTTHASQHALTLRSLSDALTIKRHIIAQLEHATKTKNLEQRQRYLRFVVIGGGATGVELAGELAGFLRESTSYFFRGSTIGEDISLILLQRGDELLLPFSSKARHQSLRALKRLGVEVRFNQEVSDVTEEGVCLVSGETIPTNTPIWVAGVKPTTIETDEEIQRTNDGRICVEPTLQLPNYPNVFVMGDLAAALDQSGNPLPMLAQVADRQAKTVSKNIALLLEDQPPQAFTYHHRGSLVSVGEWMAIAEFGNISLSGPLIWLLWRTIYLAKLITWPKRIQVAMDWFVNLFLPRDISSYE